VCIRMHKSTFVYKHLLWSTTLVCLGLDAGRAGRMYRVAEQGLDGAQGLPERAAVIDAGSME